MHNVDEQGMFGEVGREAGEAVKTHRQTTKAGRGSVAEMMGWEMWARLARVDGQGWTGWAAGTQGRQRQQ